MVNAKCRMPNVENGGMDEMSKMTNEHSAFSAFRPFGIFGIRHPSSGIDTLAPISREPLPRIVEAARAHIVSCLRLARAPRDVQERLVDEAPLALFVLDRLIGEQ